ncbi:MAG: hypothetical protein RL001_1455, partial [Pseudomonadota bacterium]
MPIVRVVTKPARSVSAVRGAVLALLVVTVPAAAYNYPRDRKDLNTYRATYKCRYDGFRKFGSVVRFTADGDERPVYF